MSIASRKRTLKWTMMTTTTMATMKMTTTMMMMLNESKPDLKTMT
jgi:hypothetical protein